MCVRFSFYDEYDPSLDQKPPGKEEKRSAGSVSISNPSFNNV